MEKKDQKIIRISISEAARLLGVNGRTIRRAIKAQEILYIVVRGRYKINMASLIEWSQKKITVRHKRNENGIGQFVDRWRIKNKLYSPNEKYLEK